MHCYISPKPKYRQHMNTALKSICFYVLSVVLGNCLSQYLAFQIPVQPTIESWFEGKDAPFARLLFSGAFSLAVLIPIVLLFVLMKTYRPYYPINVLLSSTLGLITSLLWGLILALLFDGFRNFETWAAFSHWSNGKCWYNRINKYSIPQIMHKKNHYTCW